MTVDTRQLKSKCIKLDQTVDTRQLESKFNKWTKQQTIDGCLRLLNQTRQQTVREYNY